MSELRPVLFDYWRSSASYRLRIALNLKGIPYDTVAVNLLTGAHRNDEHLARNPQGLVPVLEIDGLRLTQSLAIIGYLDETRPAPPLLPPDPAGRARVRALAHVIAIEIHPVCNLRIAARITELAGGGDETRKKWMREQIGFGLEALETMLNDTATGRFCHGDSPTLADCCLVPQLYNARRWGVPLDGFGRMVAIDDACARLDAFAAAHPDRIGAPAG